MALIDSLTEVLREEGVNVSEAIEDALKDLVAMIEDEAEGDDIEDEDYFEEEE